MQRLEHAKTFLRALYNLPSDVAMTYQRVRELERLWQRALDVAPCPFACMFVQGMKDDVERRRGMHSTHAVPLQRSESRPVWCGKTLELRGTDQGNIELQAQLPMRDVMVIVFADLRQVKVEGIFHGTEYAQACIGDCPVATFERWLPGEWLRASCSLRKES